MEPICSIFPDARRFLRGALPVAAGLLLLCAIGCQSTPKRSVAAEDGAPNTLVLVPGDMLDIKFPGATDLSGSFKIGPEGLLSMPLIGQVEASGKTAQQLQEFLIKSYATELQDKEVVVTMSASANAVYVTGAVARVGRVVMDRPLTALEAIMESGGFIEEKANLKKVTVIRYLGDQNTVYQLNLGPIMTGGPVPPFYLRPRDIVHVPAKVQWF